LLSLPDVPYIRLRGQVAPSAYFRERQAFLLYMLFGYLKYHASL